MSGTQTRCSTVCRTRLQPKTLPCRHRPLRAARPAPSLPPALGDRGRGGAGGASRGGGTPCGGGERERKREKRPRPLCSGSESASLPNRSAMSAMAAERPRRRRAMTSQRAPPAQSPAGAALKGAPPLKGAAAVRGHGPDGERHRGDRDGDEAGDSDRTAGSRPHLRPLRGCSAPQHAALPSRPPRRRGRGAAPALPWPRPVLSGARPAAGGKALCSYEHKNTKQTKPRSHNKNTVL